MRKLCGLIVAIMFSVVVGPAYAVNTWINGTTITGVQVEEDGGVILYLPSNSDPDCLEGGKLFYVALNQNNMSAEGLKNILALSLVALTTGKQISILYEESTPNCYVKQVYLSSN